MNGNTTILIVCLLIISFIEAFALLSLKRYQSGHNKFFFFGAILLYILVCFVFVYLLTFGNVAVITTLWNGLAIIVVSILAYFMYNEKLTVNQYLAMILVLLALILAVIK